jgi:hypothetical protein
VFSGPGIEIYRAFFMSKIMLYSNFTYIDVERKMENKDLSIEDLQKALPSKRRLITQEAVDLLNESKDDPEFQGESLLKTATTYESVLQRNKASIPEYLNAIKFCAYLTTNDENFTEAYKKVFMDRKFVQERMQQPTGTTKYKELTAAASRYRKSKLVVDILTLSQVPLDLMFTGQRYKALGVLAQVMETGKLDRDRINAAKELLAATNGPENVKIELDVGVKEDSAVQQLNEQLAVMAARQKNMLEAGASKLEDFGNMKPKEDDVIDGEVVNG